MIVKLKKVYYCEHCGRRRLASVKRHEEICTLNPDRDCGFCELDSLKTGTTIRSIVDEIKSTITSIEKTEYDNHSQQSYSLGLSVTSSITLEDVMNMFEYVCPACVLTVLRITKKELCLPYLPFKLDYKACVIEWWKDHEPEINYADY